MRIFNRAFSAYIKQPSELNRISKIAVPIIIAAAFFLSAVGIGIFYLVKQLSKSSEPSQSSSDETSSDDEITLAEHLQILLKTHDNADFLNFVRANKLSEIRLENQTAFEYILSFNEDVTTNQFATKSRFYRIIRLLSQAQIEDIVLHLNDIPWDENWKDLIDEEDRTSRIKVIMLSANNDKETNYKQELEDAVLQRLDELSKDEISALPTLSDTSAIPQSILSVLQPSD